MLSAGRDELICDFAETYHITDIWALPVPLLATLASGLRDDSRVRMKLSGAKMTLNTMLEAMIVDRLGLLVWMQSGAARAKKPRPEQVLDALQGKNRQKADNNLKKFRTPEDFQRAWKELTGNGD